MNDMNPLEKQLESWIPRRPSAKLRRQLFAHAAPERKPSAPVASWWLAAGAAACVFLVTIWLALPRHTHAPVIAASGASNLIASMSLPDYRCQQWNLWSAVTFDWTKGGSSLSITGRFGLGRTNL